MGLIGDETSAANVFWANFCAGFVAGAITATATCPLDVAKTRRQIQVSFLYQSSLIHIKIMQVQH